MKNASDGIIKVDMAFDFKKEYKEYYLPKNKPSIVDVPKMNYIASRGKGNPNEKTVITRIRFGYFTESPIR